jgi:Ca2+-transporting ATPase
VALAGREFTLAEDPDWTDPGWDFILEGLVLVGFAAIKDPLRADARETVDLARQAGIRIVLATGDHRLTARTIAREIGLASRSGSVMIGPELDRMTDEELGKALKRAEVFARVSPHHKLRLVRALQAQGEVVAMTGDGINDTPALKAADIGIALGSGADIAKESSDLVLLDSSIATVSAAIKEGRVIFKNIKKVIAYSLSDCFSEIVLIAGSIAAGSPLAILPAQILWINIVNDSLPQFALAFEEDDGDAMREAPVKPDEPLLTPDIRSIVFGVGLVRDFLLFTLYFLLWRHWGGSPEIQARLNTSVFLVLGVKSLFSVFSLRSFRRPVWRYNPFANRYLSGAAAISFLFLVLSVYWPPLQSLVGTVTPSWQAWAFAVFFGLVNIIMIEFVKSRQSGRTKH